ncbi:MAG: type II CAAX prenyl endopeptidase Rce1 family protein [Halobacteriales archaeon]
MTTTLTAAVGLSIAFLGLPGLSSLRDRLDAFDESRWDARVLSDLSKWVVTGLLIGYLLAIEADSLSSIGVAFPEAIPPGIGPSGPAGLVAWWIAGTVGTAALTSVVYVVYDRFGFTIPGEFVEDQATRSYPAMLLTAVTAGVTESVLYGAYPIERLAAVTGSVVAAAAITWLVFTAVHYAGDTFSLEEVVYIGAPALSVTVLYVLSGSLLVIVLVHSTVNTLSFVT